MSLMVCFFRRGLKSVEIDSPDLSPPAGGWITYSSPVAERGLGNHDFWSKKQKLFVRFILASYSKNPYSFHPLFPPHAKRGAASAAMPG